MSASLGFERLHRKQRACGLALVASLGACAVLFGCSSSGTASDPPGSSAGQGGTAGTGTAGTASAAAGRGGVGGSSGTAGASGAAGSSGGAGGSGGAAGTAGTTAGGASGSAGAGGSLAYDPCPTNGDACRVLPLGDSITDGCCGENTMSMGGSYRVELFRIALQNNKKLTFVGSHQSGPDMVLNTPFPKNQEGHPAWTIADGGGRSGLQTPIVGWLNATPPDIVTLMIGTNDVDIQLDLPNAPQRLGMLLDTIITTAPKALIVLAQIVPTQDDGENQRVRTFNDAMPALVKARADAGKHVILVDMYGAYTKNTSFKTALLANALHPTDAGYAVMAKTWWDAISNLLPSK